MQLDVKPAVGHVIRRAKLPVSVWQHTIGVVDIIWRPGEEVVSRNRPCKQRLIIQALRDRSLRPQGSKLAFLSTEHGHVDAKEFHQTVCKFFWFYYLAT